MSMTRPAADVFAPTNAAGSPRAPVIGEAQTWGIEIERLIEGLRAVVGMGLQPRDAVDFASTADPAVVTVGSVHDGVTAVAGQSFAAWTGPGGAALARNGVYVVQASGGAVRRADMDTGAEIKASFMGVLKGTAYGGSVIYVTTTDTITVGTTAIKMSLLLDRTAFATSLAAKQDAAATLGAFAGLALIANRMFYVNSAGNLALTTVTDYARNRLADTSLTATLIGLGFLPNTRSLVAALDFAEMRQLLGLRPGVEVQAYDADLAAIAALASAADKMPYATGPGTWAMADLTAFARSLLGDGNAAAVKARLLLAKTDVGLGSANNTADADKPVSTAVAAALADKAASNHSHTIGGITGLADALADRATDAELAAVAAAVSGLAGVLSGKAEVGHSHTSASATTAGFMAAGDKSKLDGIAAGATANASNADLRDRSTHTGLQAIGTVNGLVDTLDGLRALYNGVVGDARDRPGDAPSLFTSVLTGDPAARPTISKGTIQSGPLGRALRLTGADTDPGTGFIDIVPKRIFAGEAGRVYLVRAAIARTQDPSDPSQNAVEIRLQNLNGNFGSVSNVRLGAALTPTVADGPVVVSFLIGKAGALDDLDYIIPPTSLYVSPYVRVYGVGQQTDVAIIGIEDVTDKIEGGIDLSALTQRVDGIETSVDGVAGEVEAGRGTAASIDNRFDLAEGAIFDVANEVSAGRGIAASLGARFDAAEETLSTLPQYDRPIEITGVDDPVYAAHFEEVDQDGDRRPLMSFRRDGSLEAHGGFRGKNLDTAPFEFQRFFPTYDAILEEFEVDEDGYERTVRITQKDGTVLDFTKAPQIASVVEVVEATAAFVPQAWPIIRRDETAYAGSVVVNDARFMPPIKDAVFSWHCSNLVEDQENLFLGCISTKQELTGRPKRRMIAQMLAGARARWDIVQHGWDGAVDGSSIFNDDHDHPGLCLDPRFYAAFPLTVLCHGHEEPASKSVLQLSRNMGAQGLSSDKYLISPRGEITYHSVWKHPTQPWLTYIFRRIAAIGVWNLLVWSDLTQSIIRDIDIINSSVTKIYPNFKACLDGSGWWISWYQNPNGQQNANNQGVLTKLTWEGQWKTAAGNVPGGNVFAAGYVPLDPYVFGDTVIDTPDGSRIRIFDLREFVIGTVNVVYNQWAESLSDGTYVEDAVDYVMRCTLSGSTLTTERKGGWPSGTGIQSPGQNASYFGGSCMVAENRVLSCAWNTAEQRGKSIVALYDIAGASPVRDIIDMPSTRCFRPQASTKVVPATNDTLAYSIGTYAAYNRGGYSGFQTQSTDIQPINLLAI